MCIKVKYGIWNVSEPKIEAVNTLVSAGFAPLTAMVLSARGIENQRDASRYLDCNTALLDPFLMTDMDLAEARVRKA